MSDFKFICEHCGQKLRCDEIMSGSQITCPACQHILTVPQPPGAASFYAPVPAAARSEAPSNRAKAPAPASTRSRAEVTSPPTAPARSTPPPSRKPSEVTNRPASPHEADSSVSGLAVACLVCACTVVGFIPAIICGHLAKQELRNNPKLRGAGWATAGLIIGYAAALISIGTTAFFFLSSRNAPPVVVAFDPNNAADNPFTVMARKQAAEAGRPFGEYDEPATVSFLDFIGSGKKRSIKVRVASHALRAIHSLEMRLNYQDNAGNPVSRGVVTKSATPIANPATTVELVLGPVSVPSRADSAEIVVTRAEFSDGSRWQRRE